MAGNADRVLEIGPESVTRAVSLRLARLPTEATRFASAAAVLGDGSKLGRIAELAELDLDVATHAATALGRADLLRVRTPDVEFTHPVVRAAVYEAKLPTEIERQFGLFHYRDKNAVRVKNVVLTGPWAKEVSQANFTTKPANPAEAKAQLTAMGVKNVRDGGLYSLHMDDAMGYDVQLSGLDNNALTDG